MTPEIFDTTRLSTREGAILDAAIEGMTDVQISQKLDITPSTVNSYWVRIRGKLGQLSRTELVALALKAHARAQMQLVNDELATLRGEAQAHARISADYARAEVFRAALEAMPEAILVACHEALIRYANPRLEAMFGYDEGELTDRPVADLLPTDIRGDESVRIEAFMENPHPMRIGLDRVLYGQRRNGTQFRIVLLLDARPTSTGTICTCLVRDFATEIDTRVDYRSGWK